MNGKKTRFVGIILLLLISSAFGAQSTTEKSTIAENLEKNPSLSIFHAALKQSGLWAVVQNGKSLSLFVPTDSALEKEDSAFLLSTVLMAPENARRLVNSLSYHIVHGGITVFNNPETDQQLTSLSGECLLVTNTGTVINVGPEASIVDRIHSVNGVIYLVDHLLWSPFDGSHCQSTVVSGL